MKREKFLMQLNMGHSKMITTSKEDYLQIWNAIQGQCNEFMKYCVLYVKQLFCCIHLVI